MDILIDASCVMAILAEEPERDEVIEKTKGATLVSATCLPYEIANALSARVKRHLADEETAVLAYSEFEKIPIRLFDVDIKKALRIAAEEKHYAYDAYYIACALDRKLPLSSFDKGLIEIAQKRGVKCL